MKVLSLAFLLSLPAFAGNEVFVALGGFASCNNDSGQPVLSGLSAGLAQAANRRSPAPKTLSTCFGGLTQLSFEMSDSDGRVEAYDVGTGLDSGLSAATVNAVLDKLENAVRRLNPETLHVIGHSWGGFFAARLTERLNGLVSTLLTTDPISPTQCGPTGYLDHLLVPPVGCTRAPVDIGSAEQQTILGLVHGHWVNLFQNQFRYLHSGPFEALAGQNHRLQFESSNPVWNNHHSKMDKDARVWATFEAQVANN